MDGTEGESPKKTCKIVAVDDSRVNLSIIVKEIGGNTEYDVVTFDSGSDFLAAASEPDADLPDIVLLDVVMPEPDGFEVARRLKSMENTREIPIIFLTSLDDTESRVRAFEIGGADYVGKPFDRDELLAHIDAHVQLKRVHSELALKTGKLRDLFRELEQTKAELEWLNEQKNRFLAVVSRDESLTFL